ncbi:MAG TPA: PQQ-binding-like beta-propeller repeat protein [Bryobacteraceae bacterium]|nr:PQQ-binding-like beta-propeller repeat protein [Bryobacteraceae bacterium]
MPHAARLSLLLLSATTFALAAPDGADLYAKNCASCHEVLTVLQNHVAFKVMSPEFILRTLTNGAMRQQGAKLNNEERTAVAEYLSGRHLEPVHMTGRCTSTPSQALNGTQWNGWGAGLENSRFQTAEAAGINADQVPNLKLKWAFGFPGDHSTFAQPSIIGGRIFVGSAGGTVYSLDAATGCTYWSFEAASGVRSAITIGPGDVAYFGDLHANVYALDANTGKQIWKVSVEDYPTARVTGGPQLYEGRLYVPVASRDEWMAADSRFGCCKFRGSVAALDAKTGKQIWKTYTISEAAHPTQKSKNGVQLWGPSGVGVWCSPTIDAKRKVLYIGTGDGYSEPATAYSDSILALDLATGKIAWAKQITEGDVFNGNCIQQKQMTCPDKVGPDSDFGSSPILRTLPSGRRILIAGQKSGVVHALDPDKNGAILWQTRVGKGGMLGGIQWGPAADAETAYVALSDIGLIPAPEGVIPDPKAGGGLFAIQLSTGEKLWSAMPAEDGCHTPRCSPAQSAAVTVIPGVVFSGAVDGHLRAYSTKNGKILWDYDTVQEYKTVNGIPAKGGSLDGPGPTVANGLLLTTSGYTYFNGLPGNVLLAFGVE